MNKIIHGCLEIGNFSSCVQLFILLPEKFLPFDCLRAEVFQLNLNNLHIKITVTMVTQNHQISSQELRKNAERFLDFEIMRFKN